MTHLIDKSALVAEIEKLKSIQLSIFSRGETEESCYDSLTCISVYNEILSIIDALEVREIGVDTGSPEGDIGVKTIWDEDKIVRVIKHIKEKRYEHF